MSNVEIATNTVAATEKPTEKPVPEESIEVFDKRIDELVTLFEDPAAQFDEKMRALIHIPQNVQQHSHLNRDRADRLFSSTPVELFQRAFEPKNVELAYVRPVLMHILAFIAQCTSPEVNIKFKPLLENILKAAHPREAKQMMNGMIYNDVAIMIAIWANCKGEGKLVYEALRCTTGFFASQKERLEVAEFLLSTRILMNKIFMVAHLEPVSAEAVDKRGWPVAVLAIIRSLLREKTEKFSKEMRSIMWEIISIMARISGISWFNMDKSFAKLAIQMNHVEMQMQLHDAENMDVVAFTRHLRVLELYTNAICDKEMFDEEGMEVIPQTVGDSTRYLLTFWVECFLNKIKLHDQVNLAIFHFTIFLFMHEELALTDEKVRKNIGFVCVKTALVVLSGCAKGDVRGDFGQVFSDLIEKLTDFEQLDDNVPLLLITYLNKIRGCENYEDWKGRVIDCKCCLMDLRGRVDWYSKQTLKDAKKMLSDFTDPEQHEINRELFAIFDQLPQVN